MPSLKQNESALFALRWIDTQPHDVSCWQRNGKDAYGPSEKWDAIKLSHKSGGAIVIPLADWEQIKDLIEPAAFNETGPIFKLSDAGRQALMESHP